MKCNLFIPLVLLVALAPACSSDSSDDNDLDGETTAMLAACDEADFQHLPLQGPAFDESGQLLASLPESYVVATTAGWVIPEEEHQSKFDAHMGPILADIPQRDGMLGFSLGSSQVCGSARTLSLWRDEAALMEFVFGEAHGSAMGIAYDSMRGWETTHWVESATELPDWDSARQQLDDARR